MIATAGDIPTQEGLAATALLRNEFSDLKIRFINVVDLFRLQPDADHPHGLSDRDFDSLFTLDKPVIFNFRAYPWMIDRLTYRRHNHDNLHVRGYQEKGSIDTPFELAIRNGVPGVHGATNSNEPRGNTREILAQSPPAVSLSRHRSFPI